jgi:hypothetical protein
MFIRLSLCLILGVVCLQPAQAQLGKKIKRIFKKEKPVPTPPKPQRYLRFETQWSYPVHNNRPAEQGNKIAEVQYDSLGRKQWALGFNTKGDTQSHYRFEHLDSLQKMRKYLVAAGQSHLELEESYFEKNKLSSQVYYKSNGQLLHRLLYDYDTKGRLYQILHFDEKNQKTYSVVRAYHEYQPSYMEYYEDFANNERYEVATDYDSLRNPLQSIRYKASGDLVDKVVFKYDEQGRLLSRSIYKGENKLDIQEIYTYMDDQKMAKALYLGDKNELLEYTVYVYQYEYR